MRPTARPITAPTSTSIGVWPSSSRSLASWTPRMCTKSSTRRFRTSACRPAARRSPAASYMTTKVKIRAIANAAEPTPEYLPIAVVRPITIALWLLGMPPVSARTLRFKRRWRTEVSVTLAAWARAQATIGARRNLTQRAILQFRPRAVSAASAETAPQRAASRLAGAPPQALPEERFPPPGWRSSSLGQRGSGRIRARSSRRRGHAAKDAVDESARLVARKSLRQLDRLVDRRLGRHLAVDRDLVDGDPEDDAVDLRHLLELPVLRRLAQDGVELVAIRGDTMDELPREVGDVFVSRALGRVIEQHILRIVAAAFELEQDLERQLPRLVALTH